MTISAYRKIYSNPMSKSQWTKSLHLFRLLLSAGLVPLSCPVPKIYTFLCPIYRKKKKENTRLTTLLRLCPCLELNTWDFTGLMWIQHHVRAGFKAAGRAHYLHKPSTTPDVKALPGRRGGTNDELPTGHEWYSTLWRFKKATENVKE